MLSVDFARWGQSPGDLRDQAMSAPDARSRERFLALYEITQGDCATDVARRTERHPQTVMRWLHVYNESGPAALIYQHSGGRPPFVRKSRPRLGRWFPKPNGKPRNAP